MEITNEYLHLFKGGNNKGFFTEWLFCYDEILSSDGTIRPDYFGTFQLKFIDGRSEISILNKDIFFAEVVSFNKGAGKIKEKILNDMKEFK